MARLALVVAITAPMLGCSTHAGSVHELRLRYDAGRTYSVRIGDVIQIDLDPIHGVAPEVRICGAPPSGPVL